MIEVESKQKLSSRDPMSKFSSKVQAWGLISLIMRAKALIIRTMWVMLLKVEHRSWNKVLVILAGDCKKPKPRLTNLASQPPLPKQVKMQNKRLTSMGSPMLLNKELKMLVPSPSQLKITQSQVARTFTLALRMVLFRRRQHKMLPRPEHILAPSGSHSMAKLTVPWELLQFHQTEIRKDRPTTSMPRQHPKHPAITGITRLSPAFPLETKTKMQLEANQQIKTIFSPSTQI